MSSQEFSTELTPDPTLRRIVVLGGTASAILGLVIIVNLPLDRVWRALAALLWAANSLRELCTVVGAQRRCRRIRLGPGGTAQIVMADNCCVAATLLPGSVVLARLAWLRLRANDGRHYVELLREKMPQNKDWRRFQVIWRHLGAGP